MGLSFFLKTRKSIGVVTVLPGPSGPRSVRIHPAEERISAFGSVFARVFFEEEGNKKRLERRQALAKGAAAPYDKIRRG